MNNIDFSKVKINNGFWKKKLDMVRDVTVHSVYARFKETHRFEALKCRWKEGDENQPHIFWDSDVAKWIEGAAYLLHYGRDEYLEKIIEECINDIIENSDENGYFNSHFLVTQQQERFKKRDAHELYCAGHLIEAAVAYYNATGKDRFLKAMCRYADYIERVFKTEKSAAFTTPGHPELELALFRLYRTTGEKRYLELARYFIDEHGKHENDHNAFSAQKFNLRYNQDEMPLRDRTTVEGHSVRAMYLLSGAADVAAETGDKELIDACKRCFDNAVNKRMYITGGIGSTSIGEAFTVDYDLPSRTAYSETCAAISLAMFAGRMQKIEDDARYADIVERVIYNGFLSGISMDGRSFFYENPLEIDTDFNNVNTSTCARVRYPITERLEIFGCSCCPPNAVRFIPSVSGFVLGENEDTLFINQYMACSAEDFKIKIETDYPAQGAVKVSYKGNKRYLALRIPAWCRSFTLSCDYELKNGYAFIKADADPEIKLDLDMSVTLINANRRVHDAAGRVAVMRGPVVYCIEGADNGKDLKAVAIAAESRFTLCDGEFLLPSLKTTGFRPVADHRLYSVYTPQEEKIPLTFIPYYAFANRGTSDMQVWVLKK